MDTTTNISSSRSASSLQSGGTAGTKSDGSEETAAALLPRVSAPFLLLLPASAERAYRHQRARAECAADAMYAVCCLLCSALSGLSASPPRDPIAAAATFLLCVMLSLQCLLPATYMQHRRTLLVLVTLAGDVSWLRAWTCGAAAERSSATSSIDGNLDSCGAVEGPLPASEVYADLLHALLIQSGVSVAAFHALVLSLDLPWRLALHTTEVALIMHRTTVPLARLLSGPAYLPLMRQLYITVSGGMVSVLAALAALPLPLPLPLPRVSSVWSATASGSSARGSLNRSGSITDQPACLPLATVITVQLCLGLVLPLWITFLVERSRRCSFALALRHASHHDAAAATALAAGSMRQMRPPPQPCECGAPLCGAGFTAAAYTVAGFPAAVLRALLAAAHAVCFLLLVCSAWFASTLMFDDWGASSAATSCWAVTPP